MPYVVRRLADDRPLPERARLVAKHLVEYKKDPEAAKKLLSVGIAPLPKDVDAAELAAWTSVCRAIMNLHEAVNGPCASPAD